MNPIDRLVGWFSPLQGLQRAEARRALGSYEGGKSTKQRKKSKDNATGERMVVRDAATVRATMRDLERNHDIVRGGLLALAQHVIGPTGISIEPTPRKGGDPDSADYDSIHDGLARELLAAFGEWAERPEVTRTLDWVQTQEMAFRTMARDGEGFAQLVEGTGAFIKHSTSVPLSLELLEADIVPLWYERDTPLVTAGIERNAWGQPVGFYCYKQHPGDGGWLNENALKRVPAERMLHFANRERFSGLRGISMFASSIDRLLDIKDYEESERLAARLAARMAWWIRRDKDMDWQPTDLDGNAIAPHERDMSISSAAIFDQFLPGEELEETSINRPNPNLGEFRRQQLRAASRPARISYSSFAGDYDGTYSAQRQELVESYAGYRMLTAGFVSSFVRPVWQRFVYLAIASGRVRVPSGVRPETVAQAQFRGPAMPWIDPSREMSGLIARVRGGVSSLTQEVAERGRRIQDVMEEIKREQDLAKELGIVLDTNALYVTQTGVAQSNEPITPDDDRQDQGARSRGSRPARMRVVTTGESA